MKRFSFSSLRARLLLLVFFAIIPALGLTLYTGAEMRRAASVEAEANSVRLAQSVSSTQDDLFERARQLLTALAQIPMVRGGNPAECNSLFSMLVKKYASYTNLGVVTPAGNIFCSGLPLPGPVNVADRAWFRRALESRDLVIGDYIVGRVTGKPTLGLGYPVLDEAGEVQAVLYAGLDLGWLNKIAAKTQLPTGTTLTVIDRKGTILVRFPDPEKWVGKSMPETPLFQTILHQGEGTAELPGMDGVPRLYGFTRLGKTGDAYVSVGIPKEVAFAPANHLLARNLIALGIVAVFALVAAWFGSNLFVLRQVNALTMATRRLGEGELSVRTELPYGKGELSELARTFDQMAGSMERLVTERKQSEQRLASLHEINAAMTSTLDLHAALDLLIEKVNLFLPYGAGLVWLANKESGLFERVACWNVDEKDWKGRRLGMSPLVRAAIEEKAPVIVKDLWTDPRSLDPDFCRRNGLISYLGIPLTVKGEVLGVIVFLTREEHQFTEQEIEFLSTLAGQAAIAIHNSRLYEQTLASRKELELTNQRLARLLREISSLYAVLTPLAPADSLNQLLEKIIYRLMEATGADAALIRLQDNISGTYRCATQRGFPDDYLETVVNAPPGGAAAWVFQNAQPIIASDIAAEPRLKGKIQLQVGLRSCAMLPLMVQNEVRGIIHLASRELGYFSERQRDHLMAIARQMGIALENRDLFDKISTVNNELEKVNKDLNRREDVQKLLKELSQDITSLDIDSMLKKLTEKIRKFFKVDVSDLRVVEKGVWRVIGVSGIEPNLLNPPGSGTIRGLSNWTVEHRRLLMVQDVSRTDLPTGTTLKNLGLHGYLGVPLFSRGGEVIGVLRALSYEPREFTQEEMDLLQQMANGAAIALENARLLEHIKNQAVELEKANKVKDEFLGFVSHELKTPVNSIRGYAAMVQDKMLGDLNAEQERAMSKVIKNSDDLIGMINSLLEATKIEAGAVSMESREVNLCDFLEELRSTYSVPFNKELDLDWDYASELSVVRTDSEKLKHVLENLINNAIKYTDKGSVTVSARRLPDFDAVEFKIADTGVGIPEEALPYIFEMFSQVDGSQARACGGVGLGLHIVKKFAELLGGKIAVQSELNKGSVFTVTIPCDGARQLAIKDRIVPGGRAERGVDFH